MHRPKRHAFRELCALCGVLILISTGCNGSGPASAPTNVLATLEPAADFLPTPTLALPVDFDPLHPPTPIILATRTPAIGSGNDAPALTTETAVPVQTLPPPTASLPPHATPQELFDFARKALAEGDYTLAAAAFRKVVGEPAGLTDWHVSEAHLGLAVALLRDGQADEALVELNRLVQTPQTRIGEGKTEGLVQPVRIIDIANYHRGVALAESGEHGQAIEAFLAYLRNNPDMAAYIQPLIADGYQALGDMEAVIAALESSLDGAAQRFKQVENRLRLAELYLARKDFPAAIEQYDAIHDLARTEATKGQMMVLAGSAEILGGNTDAGHERFLRAVNDYPRAAESYQALIALIDAGVPVDEYQRGLVDYYAGAYIPAIEAFDRYLEASDAEYRTDAHDYMAWSYEQLGDLENALASLESLQAHEPARALFERAELLRRAARPGEALAAYDEFLALYPEDERAVTAAWSAAVLADEQNEPDAAERYLLVSDTFPFDERAPAALARAAEILERGADTAGAIAIRQRLVEQYPANIDGAEALFRLLQAAEAGEGDQLSEAELAAQAGSLSPTNYFALRSLDYVKGLEPFTGEAPLTLPDDAGADRAAAEIWLRERLPAEGYALPEGELGEFSPALASDPRRLIGEKLWQLGLYEAAKVELEELREAYAADPLASYQLALYFSELGLFRSSIIAASGLLRMVDATVFDAPRFLGRLSYPVHYSDLILPLAERYGFDPRLQFALVRQESLFESFARSGAAAQGLSQVIPDTGAWIAQRIAWPDFENEDLYKPYVGLNFGAYYLSQQLSAFDGQVHAALAAYNGGPGNAARWYETAGDDHDLFVDTVDFPETRLYIERIYEGFDAYRYLYSSP